MKARPAEQQPTARSSRGKLRRGISIPAACVLAEWIRLSGRLHVEFSRPCIYRNADRYSRSLEQMDRAGPKETSQSAMSSWITTRLADRRFVAREALRPTIAL